MISHKFFSNCSNRTLWVTDLKFAARDSQAPSLKRFRYRLLIFLILKLTRWPPRPSPANALSRRHSSGTRDIRFLRTLKIRYECQHAGGGRTAKIYRTNLGAWKRTFGKSAPSRILLVITGIIVNLQLYSLRLAKFAVERFAPKADALTAWAES